MPRFIGPGCITIISFFAFLSRSAVIPKFLKYSNCCGNAAPSSRSNCILKTFTASASRKASSISCVTFAPIFSTPAGISIRGAQTVTFAPSLVNPQILERATREWAMSPTMLTFKPSILPNFSFNVKISSNACVGCSCQPSPALTTLISRWRASIFAAPE